MEEWVYVYRIGGFTRLYLAALAVAFGISAFVMFVQVQSESASFGEFVLGLVLTLSVLLVAALLVGFLRTDSRSSQTVKFTDTKVQLPMTKGHNDTDYLLLADVTGLKFENDYHDHCPALLALMPSKTVAYKSMYFESAAEFRDFVRRFEGLVGGAEGNLRKGI